MTTEAKDDKDKRVHRLRDLLVEEVGLVVRGANKKKRWLVVKRVESDMLGSEVTTDKDGKLTTESGVDESSKTGVEKADMIPKPVKEKVVGMLEESSNRLASLINMVKEASDGEATGVPSPISTEAKNIAGILRGVLSKYPSPTTKVEKSESSRDAARDLLWRVMREVDSGAIDSEDEKKATEAILALLKETVAKADTPEEEEEMTGDEVDKAALSMPKDMKDSLLKELNSCSEVLMAVISSIKSLEETDEQVMKPVPDSIGTKIGELAGKLEGIQEMKEMQTEKSEGEVAQGVSSEARKILAVLLGKLRPGEILDEESFKSLQQLKSMLGQGSKQAPEAEEDETEKIAEPEGKEKTEKAGQRQMSMSRRKEIKGIVQQLMQWLENEFPEANLSGKWPKKSPAKKVEKSSAIVEVESSLTGQIEELKKQLEDGRKELVRLQKSIVPSQVSEVNNVVVVEEADTDWPHDLNEELTEN